MYTQSQIKNDQPESHEFWPISLAILNRFPWNFAMVIFYSNPNSGKHFAKLYLIFQKVDYLLCNKILE